MHIDRCLEPLLGHGIFPELIVGASVGALNGVFLAKAPTADGVSEFRDLRLGLEPRGPFRESTMNVKLHLFTGRQYLSMPTPRFARWYASTWVKPNSKIRQFRAESWPPTSDPENR